MIRLITNPQQIADLKQKEVNGEIFALHQTIIQAQKENEFGLEPGDYLAYQYEVLDC